MREIPEILRSSKIVGISVLIYFMLLIGILAMQSIRDIDTFSQTAATKKVSGTLTSGISRHFEERLKEKEARGKRQATVEKLNVETVTTSATTEMAEVDDESETIETEVVEEAEPEILYKSIEEVKISRDMDLTQTTGLSKKDFCKLLANFEYDYAGLYERHAGLIWDLSQEYQVNEIFICGVFALESLYGSNEKHIDNHNYGSIMNQGELVRYASDEEGIEANFKLFANCYLTPEGKYYKGVTLDSIGDTYCPPTPECPSWADKVYCCMQYFLE